MNTELLEQARKHLVVQGINLRDVHQTFHDDFEPGFDELEMKLQFRAGPIKNAKVFTHENSASRTVRFYYNCGFRAVEVEEGETITEDDVRCELTATFTADYLVHDDACVTDECLQEFGRVNVGYHIWPYWRELVQSFNARSGMPVITIPFYKTPE